MKTQSDCISADTYFRLRHAQRPPWLRARAPFVSSVDETCRTTVIDTVYPPLAIQPLTLDRLGWNALRGNSPTLNLIPKPARVSHADVISPRACHGAFRVASPDATGTNSVPGKIHSPLGVLRGRITVGTRPRLPVFSENSIAFFAEKSRPGGLSYQDATAFLASLAEGPCQRNRRQRRHCSCLN